METTYDLIFLYWFWLLIILGIISIIVWWCGTILMLFFGYKINWDIIWRFVKPVGIFIILSVILMFLIGTINKL